MHKHLIKFVLAFNLSTMCAVDAQSLCMGGHCYRAPTGFERKPIYSFGSARERKELARRIRFVWSQKYGRELDIISARISEQRTRLEGGASKEELRSLRSINDTVSLRGTAQLVEFKTKDEISIRQLWDYIYVKEQLTVDNFRTVDQIERQDRMFGPYWRQFDLNSSILVDDRGSWGAPIINPIPVWDNFAELKNS